MNKKIILVFSATIFLSVLILATVYLIHKNFFQKTNPNSITSSKSSCIILEDQYCSKWEKVTLDGKLFGLGFKLPKGTKIYSPFNGQLALNTIYHPKNKEYKGLSVFSTYTTNNPKQFLFELYNSDRSIDLSWTTKEANGEVLNTNAGDLIGSLGDQNVDIVGNYNLVISFKTVNPLTHVYENDTNLTKQFFKDFNP